MTSDVDLTENGDFNSSNQGFQCKMNNLSSLYGKIPWKHDCGLTRNLSELKTLRDYYFSHSPAFDVRLNFTDTNTTIPNVGLTNSDVVFHYNTDSVDTTKYYIRNSLHSSMEKNDADIFPTGHVEEIIAKKNNVRITKVNRLKDEKEKFPNMETFHCFSDYEYKEVPWMTDGSMSELESLFKIRGKYTLPFIVDPNNKLLWNAWNVYDDMPMSHFHDCGISLLEEADEREEQDYDVFFDSIDWKQSLDKWKTQFTV